MEIAKDIRRISRLWHVLKREVIYTKSGCRTRWIYNETDSCDDMKFEEYMTDFKEWEKQHVRQDKEKNKIYRLGKIPGYCFETKEMIAPFNVFEAYNHQTHRSEFIAGHLNEDFDLHYRSDFEPRTYEDFKRLEKEND